MEVRFKGGQKAQAYLDKLEGRLNRASRLQVGFLGDQTYPDGTPVATVAAVQNNGSPAMGIPPRPFMSNAVRDHRAEWNKAMSVALTQNDMDATAALTVVGLQMEEDIRQSIRDTNSPPNAPSTIRRKGFDDPLVASGLMIDSVASKVT